MPSSFDAYLDIETTGLSPYCSQITVVGIYSTWEHGSRFVQLVGDEVSSDNLIKSLRGVATLYTYTGLVAGAKRPAWRLGLKGGLKCVERQLRIPRRLRDVNGYQAIRLWWRYVNDYDEAALETLLQYNKEDVLNLKVLRERLLPPVSAL